MPSDEGEQECLNLHYHSVRLALDDKITRTPIDNPRGILDIGTGTGAWALDAADAWPEAEAIGTDLPPIQPTWVSPNLQFEVADADEPWTFAAERFTLAHSRAMNGYCIASRPHFYAEAFACLAAGGWVENQEFDCLSLSDDNTLPENSHLAEFPRPWNQGCEKIGKTGRCDRQRIPQQTTDAGFINVHIVYKKLPIGIRPKDPMLKESGRYGLLAVYHGLYGTSVRRFRDVLGWSEEKPQIFLIDVRKELMTKSIHSCWPLFVVIGQKPPRDEE